MSGSVASAEAVSSGTGIRIASRDPDSLELGPEQPVARPVPVPDWVAEVQPLGKPAKVEPAAAEAKPGVTLNVLPFDVRTATAESERREDEWRERFRGLESRLEALATSRLEQQARELEAATRQFELQERDRRLETLETSLQELKSAPRAEANARPEIQVRKSDGEPALFDLEARQAELGEVFQQLARSAGVEVIVSPAVQGRLSVLLTQKPLEELLSLLASSQSCVVEREGNLWRVVSRAEIAARSGESPRPETRTFVPQHVAAKELAEFLRPLLSPASGQISAMEAGPAADGDAEPHGVLLVRDVPHVMAEVERVLRQFDVPLVEVELLAQVLSVELTGLHAHGVTLTGGRIVKQVPIPCPVCGGSHESVSAVTTVSSPAGEFVEAPGGLKYAFVKGDGQSVVAMLRQTGTTHPIGTPRVRVRNRQSIELVLSSLAPLVAGSEDLSVRRLRVRPAALPSREFELTIAESRDQPGSGTAVLSADVTLAAGTTVVLGGIVEQTAGTNREILVLLTPRIRGQWPVAGQAAEESAAK